MKDHIGFNMNRARGIISRICRLTLVCSLLLSCFTVSASGPIEVRSDISSLLKSWSFKPATNKNLFCSTPNNIQLNTDYPHADYMANIASAKNIVIFAHGFIPMQAGGKHDLAGMVKIWRHHIDIVEEVDNSAYCVVTWDTEFGHDDRDRTLARFLATLIPTVSDRRIRHAVRDPVVKPTITLVGHSAGGNYLKFSYLKYTAYRKQPNHYPKDQLTYTPAIRILTMGTPHLGTESANDASMYAFFGILMAELWDLKNVSNLAGFALHKSTTRGANLLAPVHRNPVLAKLNKQFATHFPKRDFFAIAGENDEYVNVQSAAPYFATRFYLKAGHDDFLRPDKKQTFRNGLKIIYKGNRP
jgi:hypothetical protein